MNKRLIRLFSKGQTMIELVVTMGLVAVVMTTIVVMVNRSIQLSEASETRKVAIDLVRTQIEYIRADKYNYDSLTEFATAINNGNYTPISKPGYFLTLSATDNSTYIELSVTVAWRDVKGNHSITNNTKVSNEL